MASPYKILIVDDDEKITEIIYESLSCDAYELKTCHRAQDALIMIKDFQPHLVITDQDMPGLTGLEMLRRLRKEENYVSVIFISASRDTKVMVQALHSGADDFIYKPFPLEELHARVEVCLRNNSIHHQLLEANAKLNAMVDRDHLTGLFNMRNMYERVDYEIQRAIRNMSDVACVMLDMDHFKSVNDDHDHLFGSFVLQEMGKILKQNLREIDFAARYGGDEFLIVLTDTDASGVETVLERIRLAVQDHIFANDKDRMRLTVSIGYALLSNMDSNDARSLIRKADDALYLSKKSGRNKVSSYKKPAA